jgi:hypothetical protein
MDVASSLMMKRAALQRGSVRKPSRVKGLATECTPERPAASIAEVALADAEAED